MSVSLITNEHRPPTPTPDFLRWNEVKNARTDCTCGTCGEVILAGKPCYYAPFMAQGENCFCVVEVMDEAGCFSYLLCDDDSL
jgi:hypothetical protein